MALNFPNSPSVNDTYTSNNITWTWDGVSWRSGISSNGETDPIYSSSPASNVTNTLIGNWDTAYGWGDHSQAGYLTAAGSEIDPVFTASASFGIDVTDIANWDSVYGWGDHGAAGYLTSFTETDPIYAASPAAAITNINITNWNTAHGWGDHSTQGYVTTLGGFTEVDLTTNAPANGNILKYNGTSWVPAADDSGGGGVTTFTGLSDTPNSFGNPGQYLKVNTAADGLEWTAAAAASTSNVSSTFESGRITREMGPKTGAVFTNIYSSGSGHAGYGLTDVGTYPQDFPTYSDSQGGTGNPDHPISYAFDGDIDTYADLGYNLPAGGWSKITFTNPIGKREAGTGNPHSSNLAMWNDNTLKKIVIGYDGNGKFGFNDGTHVNYSPPGGDHLPVAGTNADGTVKEMIISANIHVSRSGASIFGHEEDRFWCDNLYFTVDNVGDRLHLYYVYFVGADWDQDHYTAGGHKATIVQHDAAFGSGRGFTGKNGFVLHDGGDALTPSGWGLYLTSKDVNSVVAVNTINPRYVVLPLGSTCTEGDIITILDVGIGEYLGNVDWHYNGSSGNAAQNPILIFPNDEEGIQGTERSPSSYSSHGVPTMKSTYNNPDGDGTGKGGHGGSHGTPIAITRNGGSVKLVYCGDLYGWRLIS